MAHNSRIENYGDGIDSEFLEFYKRKGEGYIINRSETCIFLSKETPFSENNRILDLFIDNGIKTMLAILSLELS